MFDSHKLLSQNFLWNQDLVHRLVRESSISEHDHVLEIGAGQGIITEYLLGVSRKVTAIEADASLFNLLHQKFAGSPCLTLVNDNFLKFPLPENGDYKVFSNIPFSVTGEIIKKLIFAKNPPTNSYLVVQIEAAEKFSVNDQQNTMLAILAFPWFETGIVHEFSQSDFRPLPGVDSVMLRLERRRTPLLPLESQLLFRDYVVYRFTRDRAARRLAPANWLAGFFDFSNENDPRKRDRVGGSFEKWRSEEQKLVKIHRTRSDADWKNL